MASRTSALSSSSAAQARKTAARAGDGVLVREGAPRRRPQTLALGLDRELAVQGAAGEEVSIDRRQIRVPRQDRALDLGGAGVERLTRAAISSSRRAQAKSSVRCGASAGSSAQAR